MRKMLAAAALSTLFLVACAGPKPSAQVGPGAPGAPVGKPHYGGTLKVGAFGSADTVLPIYAHTAASVDDISFVYDPLVNVDPDFNVVPWLAEKWEISKDGKTYTFHLRHDAKWTDGVPITSEDQKFEYDLTTNPAANASYRADYDVVESVSTPDKWTVVYKLKEPNAPFLAGVIGALPHVPLPAHIYQKIPPSQLQHMDFSKNLVTSGAYALKEWKHDDHMLLVSNKRWWGGRAYIDNIYIKEFQNETAVRIALQNSEVDTSFGLGTPDWLQIRDDPRFIHIHNPNDYLDWWVPNMKNPILADLNVRKAIMYAYDRKTEAEKLFHHEDVPAFSPIPWAQKWAFDAATENAYPYDPEKAKQILDADGWKLGPDGYRHKNGQLLYFVTGLISGNVVAVKGFELFQANLKAVGIKTDAKQLEFSVFFQEEERGHFDLDGGGIGGGADPDPFIILHSQAVPPKGLNYGHFSDPAIDKIIDQARQETDRVKRAELYKQLQRLVIEKVPDLFDVMPYYRNVLNNRVQGVNPARTGSSFTATVFDEPKWWIAQ